MLIKIVRRGEGEIGLLAARPPSLSGFVGQLGGIGGRRSRSHGEGRVVAMQAVSQSDAPFGFFIQGDNQYQTNVDLGLGSSSSL